MPLLEISSHVSTGLCECLGRCLILIFQIQGFFHLVIWKDGTEKILILFYTMQTDRAAMLDEILDYVKFLRLQVKVQHIMLV
jgi:hypothetical protein